MPSAVTSGYDCSADLHSLEVDFTSFHYLPDGLDGQRRPSLGSFVSTSDIDPFSLQSAESTSPATSMTSETWTTVHPGQYIKDGNDHSSASTILCVPSSNMDHDSAFWQLPQHDSAWLPFFENCDAESDPILPSGIAGVSGLTCHQVLSNPAMNPSLSRAIFNEALESDTVALWQASTTLTPPRTIAPGREAHCMPTTSPAVRDCSSIPNSSNSGSNKWECLAAMTPPHNTMSSASSRSATEISPANRDTPLTPLRSNYCGSSDVSSSPLALSTHVLPSQRDIDEMSYMMRPTHVDWSPEDMRRIKGHTSRLARRHYARKGARASTRHPKIASSKSGIDCPEIIPRNEFACKYPNCIDKTTGEQKRFKRQEHKKRHEKTVHEKSNHNQYGCWVPGCKTKPFSRTDNLKSHLRKTHGKKSAAARNRYVATQDEASSYYDPGYVGLLTVDGLPACA